MSDSSPRRLVVGISGASGAALGIRLLERLRGTACEVHLTVTPMAIPVIEHETGKGREDLEALATRIYAADEMMAPIASGSFAFAAMVVIPCSMKTLAGIASGYAENLLLRAADVCLKERRDLVLVTRESPLSLVHLDNMRRVTRAGATVLPPVVTLYTRPASVDEVIDQIVGKVLDRLGIESEGYYRWG